MQESTARTRPRDAPPQEADAGSPAGGRPGVLALWGGALRGAARMVRTGGLPLLALVTGFALVLLLVVSPLIGWLFREALRANGMLALDLDSFSLGAGIPVTLGLLLVIVLVAFLLLSAHFGLIVLALRRAQLGQALLTGGLLRDLGQLLRKTLRPSALPLIAYLFLLLPLTGFGFAGVLTRGIAIPSFISGELLKSPATAVAWTVLGVVLVFLAVRLALTLPVFALTPATGGRALRLSWRLTRGRRMISLAGAVITVLVGAAVVSAILLAVAVLPTAVADAVSPDAAAVVAAYSLAIATILGGVLTALVTASVAAVLVALLSRVAGDLPADAALLAPADPGEATSARRTSRAVAAIVGAVALAVAVVTGTTGIAAMDRLAAHPETLVLGHRGFSGGGAENTLGGLEAAAAAGADLVEIDVMQTRDRRFVVMHDADLSRLTGQSLKVKDLTLDELTALTVRDLAGHEGAIPSLASYMQRAQELGMTLLIEIKLGGLDTPDHVDLLVAELEELGVLHDHIFHTLDHASVERLKHLHPDLTVGYILALAAVGVPETPADFLVIEEWSATQQMQDLAAAAGLGFFSWTVNDEGGLTELLRRDADGIITDRPDRARELRDEMADEQGLAPVLLDVLSRFVLVL